MCVQNVVFILIQIPQLHLRHSRNTHFPGGSCRRTLYHWCVVMV